MRGITRRQATTAAGALAFGGWRAWAQPAAPQLAFLAVGDWGREGADHQRAVAVQMGKAAAGAKSRFTLSTGDNFYDDGVAGVTDRQFRTSFEDVYTSPALMTPWYVALGNHDYRGNPQAQVEYSARSPRWKMPQRYFQFAPTPDVEVFVIDSSPLVHKYRTSTEGEIAGNVSGQDVPAQLKWLDEVLGRSKAAWKLVVGHHTIHSGGGLAGDTPELVQMVKPILERRGVQAYINGHDHDLQHIRRGGLDYITSGGGSRVYPTSYVEGTRFAKAVSGFAVISVSGPQMRLEFRDFTGAPIYQDTLHRDRLAAVRQSPARQFRTASTVKLG